MNSVPIGIKVGYGVGDFAANLVFQSVMLYLMYFFTDVFMIGASAAGSIFLMSKIWDAVSDPIMGCLSDRTRSRWGQKRPFLLFGAVPLGVSFWLLFAAPALSPNWKIVYAAAAFLIFCTAYTVVNIPYGAITASMTLDSHERSSITGYRMFFAILGTLVVAGATRPLVARFADDVTGFRIVSLIYALLAVGFTLVTFSAVRERIFAGDASGRFNLNEIWVVTRSNRPFIVLTLGMFCHLTAICIMAAMVNYFFKYNLKNEPFIPIAFISLFATAALAIPLWVFISKRQGKKAAFNAGMGLLGLTLIGLYFIKALNPFMLVPVFVAGGIGLSTIYLSPWSMIPDTVEYAEQKTGLRREGILYGLFFFGQKLAAAFAGFIAGQGLDLAGYLPNAEQSASALAGIRLLMTLAPVSLIVIGMGLISLYPIDRRLHDQILRELQHESILPKSA